MIKNYSFYWWKSQKCFLCVERLNQPFCATRKSFSSFCCIIVTQNCILNLNDPKLQQKKPLKYLKQTYLFICYLGIYWILVIVELFYLTVSSHIDFALLLGLCRIKPRYAPDGVVPRVSSRWPNSLQQRSGFRKVTRKAEPKKAEDPVPTRPDPPEATLQNRAPPSPPRAFGRLVRPLLFTVGVGGVGGEPRALPRPAANSMSVYRLLLRLGGHLAVRGAQVQSPELLQRAASRLAGEGAASETRRRPKGGERVGV